MEKLSQINATMNVIQAQLNKLSAETKTRPQRKYYCWICRGNLSHRSKVFTSNKLGHKIEA